MASLSRDTAVLEPCSRVDAQTSPCAVHDTALASDEAGSDGHSQPGELPRHRVDGLPVEVMLIGLVLAASYLRAALVLLG